MPRRNWTEEQKKAWGEDMKARREAKKAQASEQPKLATHNADTLGSNIPDPPQIESPDTIGTETPEDNTVGARLTVDNSEIKSMLESITEDTEVDIYNPLDQGFRVQFTITAYQSVNLTPQERDVREKAGLPLAKDMNQSIGHAVKFTVLPPHKVTRLPGKVAHVAIKQLRNYIMRVDRDNYADVADPAALRSYEERIIMKISNPFDTIQIEQQDEIDRKIAELNPLRG